MNYIGFKLTVGDIAFPEDNIIIGGNTVDRVLDVKSNGSIVMGTERAGQFIDALIVAHGILEAAR